MPFNPILLYVPRDAAANLVGEPDCGEDTRDQHHGYGTNHQILHDAFFRGGFGLIVMLDVFIETFEHNSPLWNVLTSWTILAESLLHPKPKEKGGSVLYLRPPPNFRVRMLLLKF